MEEKWFNPQDEKKIRKNKHIKYVIFGIFAVLVILLAVWLISFLYWRTFTTERWLEHPEQRAKMTLDMIENYGLIGMTEDEIISLLGQSDNENVNELMGITENEIISLLGLNDNERVNVNQDNRFVYYLGNKRTIIHHEWLLIDFEDGKVRGYSMLAD